jgi:hypothetical protein
MEIKNEIDDYCKNCYLEYALINKETKYCEECKPLKMIKVKVISKKKGEAHEY